jgi:uncharacterized protein DUF6977
VREVKRDPRLRESGRLIAFEFDGVSFPLEPKTVFYDWLYVTFLYPWREWARTFTRMPDSRTSSSIRTGLSTARLVPARCSCP